jgi:hypothetical protein
VYIGQDLQVAFSSYLNIDDISGSFNSVTTSFALTVNGSTPVPLPINSQQCLISVGGIIQRPDDTGTEGFRLSGSNIVFSSAPNTGEDFFGTILAGADYINAGVNFPDGQSSAPSITFDQDLDTGFFRSSSGAVSFSSNGVNTATLGSNSFTAPSFIPTSSSVPSNGVFLPAANSVAIATNGTQQATVDSSGRLLVGTSTAPSSGLIQASDAAGAELTLARNDASVVAGNQLGRISWFGNDGGTYEECGRITCEADLDHAAGDKPSRLVFSTTADAASSPTERIRISSDGSFRCFAANTVVRATSALGAGTSEYLYGGYHSGTNTVSGTTSFAVFTNGNVVNTNNSYGALSDLKLKENIVDATPQWSDIKALQVRNYNFKEGQTHTQIGLIAQEVELVSPGLVTESPDRDEDGNDLGTVTKSVNYSVLYMKAVKALQEAMERIETLESKVAALEAA